MTVPPPSPADPRAAGHPIILVSACLMGVACRYDGRSKRVEGLATDAAGATLVPVCPEELGELATPRARAELRGGDGHAVLDGRARVVDELGCDVTAAFLAGAARTVSIARAVGATAAWLTERSPSCGLRATHADGKVIGGPGVTAAILGRLGLAVTGIGDPAGEGSGGRTTAPQKLRTIVP